MQNTKVGNTVRISWFDSLPDATARSCITGQLSLGQYAFSPRELMALTCGLLPSNGRGARRAGEGTAGRSFDDYELLKEIARGQLQVSR